MTAQSTTIKLIDIKYSWKNLSLWDFLNEGNIPSGWEDFFMRDDVQKDLYNISKELDEETCTIYPPIHKTFRAFIPLDEIKVVVLAQDPYHDGSDEDNCAATGLCFSVNQAKGKINPSLRNIYKELKQEGFTPVENGDLTSWVDQGCFMLNKSLTVAKSDPDSHTRHWYDFTDKVISHLAKNRSNLVWLLMGRNAQQSAGLIEGEHLVLKTSHPSPFSFKRASGKVPAFLGSNLFRQTNEYLKSHYGRGILW